MASAFEPHVAMGGVRLLERLLDAVDGPAGTPARINSRQRSSDLKVASVPSSSARSAATWLIRRALVRKRASPAGRAHQVLTAPAKLAVVAHAEEDLGVAGRELVVRRDVGMRAAEAAGRLARAASSPRAERAGKARVEQRGFHALSLPVRSRASSAIRTP